MKASLRFPEVEKLKGPGSRSDFSSMATKLGRGRGLAITFKNEYLNDAKDEEYEDALSVVSYHSTRPLLKEEKKNIGRKSDVSDGVRSEDEIIICTKAEKEEDPEIRKTYSIYSCWPSVEDKIWKCWDEQSKVGDIKEDDNSDFLLDYDYAAIQASNAKAKVTPFPKATVTSYPKGNVASFEITTGTVRNFPKGPYYDPKSYSISLPIKCLPRQFYNKLNNSKPEGEFSYRFDTGYDPNLSSRKRVDENRYNNFHRKINTPYTRKINYWRSKENDKVIDKTDEVKDPISALYIWCSRNRAIPTFTFTNELEIDGKVMLGMVFVCRITLYEHETTGKGTNKKEAKRVAAEKMLDVINSGFEDKYNEKLKSGSSDKEKEGDDVIVESEEEETTDDEEEETETETETDDEEKETDDEEKEKTDDEGKIEQVKNKKDKDKLNKKKTLESSSKEETKADEEEKNQSDEEEKIESPVKLKNKSDKKSKFKSDNEGKVRLAMGLQNQSEVIEIDLDLLKKMEAEKKEKEVSDLKNIAESKSDKEEDIDADKEKKPDKIEESVEESKSDKKEETETGEAEKNLDKIKKSVKKNRLDKKERFGSSDKIRRETDGKEAATRIFKNLSEEDYKRHINPISFLQEICIKRRPKWTLPKYKIEDFGSIFKCQIEIIINGESVVESGFGHTKKEAKTKAAANAVKIFEERKFIPKAE